ncbi:hypothetical protein vseg_011816 [Gypsophila vaccaria]
MMATVIDPGFGDDDLKTMDSLSPLEMLASVAEKVYEFEHQVKPKKKPLPFNLNVRPRTYGRPRSSPIDVHALFPCLNHKRKLKERDGDENDSGELGFDRASKKTRLVVRLQPPELPSEYKQKVAELDGSDLKFVTQKKLLKSDVRNKRGFLTMPCSNCWFDFGEIGEKQVKVFQSANNFTEMIMTFSKSCAASSYVLTGSWKDVVEANDLKKDDVVQVWSFRQDDQLCFALIKL